MAEVKRYGLILLGDCGLVDMREVENGGWVYHSDYAALERRLRIVERAFDNEWFEIAPEVKSEKFAQAEREIDSEQKEQQK